jgi:hypothetical protein
MGKQGRAIRRQKQMTKAQRESWDALTELESAVMLRVITDYFGEQLLSEIRPHLIDEGILEEEEEE